MKEMNQTKTLNYEVELPDAKSLTQGEEFFFFRQEGEEKKMKLHDYEDIYQVPFLYEKVLYDLLKCNTPNAISDLLEQAIEKSNQKPEDMKVLELGAGSGIFGEHLKNMGFGYVAGLDIYEVAKEAAYRDRPDLYDHYYVDDLTDLKPASIKDIEEKKYDVVAVASATGWGNHIPTKGFENAFQLLPEDGLFVYHVKRDDQDPECVDLCNWIDEKIEKGHLEVKAEDKCFHRYSLENEPIYYDVIIGQKSN